MLRKILNILLIYSATLTISFAGLRFDKILKEVTTKPDTKAVFIEFAFENKSDEIVTIVEYDAPCTCMGARIRRPDGLESRVFKPGDKGVIIGKLEFENFKGTIDKMITIRTDKDKTADPSIQLTCRVTIPVVIGADVEKLEWVVGGALEAKEFSIKVNYSKPINIAKHKMGFGGDKYFDYKLEVISEGREYKVTVTPKKTNVPIVAPLKFYTDSEITRFKLVQVFVNISPKKK